jgi:hypothetical protein
MVVENPKPLLLLTGGCNPPLRAKNSATLSQCIEGDKDMSSYEAALQAQNRAI